MSTENEPLTEAGRALLQSFREIAEKQAIGMPFIKPPARFVSTGRDAIIAIEREAADPDDEGQCPERCLGIVGHSGPHQTSDYVPAAPEQARDTGGLQVHVNDGSAHDRAMAWSEGHTVGFEEGREFAAGVGDLVADKALRAFWNGDEPRRVIVELPPIGPDGRCTRCGAVPSRDTGSCRCHRAVIEHVAALSQGAAPEQARDTGGQLLAQAMYETEPNTRADDTNEPADWTYASGFAIDLYTRWAARVTGRLRAALSQAAPEEPNSITETPEDH